MMLLSLRTQSDAIKCEGYPMHVQCAYGVNLTTSDVHRSCCLRAKEMLRNEFRCIFTYTHRDADHRRHPNNVREYKNGSLPIVHEKYTRELGITHTMR